MTAQVTALCERLFALRTCERSLACVLAEMIAQITTLLEYRHAVPEATLEVDLNLRRLRTTNLNRLMPMSWDSFKGF